MDRPPPSRSARATPALQVYPASPTAWSVASEWTKRDPHAKVVIAQQLADVGLSSGGRAILLVDLTAVEGPGEWEAIAERIAEIRFEDAELPIVLLADPARAARPGRLSQHVSEILGPESPHAEIVAALARNARNATYNRCTPSPPTGSADTDDHAPVSQWPFEPLDVLRLILDEAPIAISMGKAIEEDPYRYHYIWNRELTRLTGFTRDEANEHGWFRLLQTGDLEENRRLARLASQTMRTQPGRYEYVVTFVHRDGDHRVARTLTVPMVIGGEPYVIALGMDITRTQRLEQDVIAAAEREQDRLHASMRELLDKQLEPALRSIQRAVDMLSDDPSASDRLPATGFTKPPSGSGTPTPPATPRIAPGSPGAPGSLGVRDSLVEAEQAVRRTLAELSATSATINPPPGSTLRDRLGELIHYASRSLGLRAKLSYDADVEPLDEEAANHLARIAQEAVTNVARHAHATRLRLRLRRGENGRRRLEIDDDGCGFDPSIATGGTGLRAMQSRATMIGYVFRVESGPLAPADRVGTRVIVAEARSNETTERTSASLLQERDSSAGGDDSSDEASA